MVENLNEVTEVTSEESTLVAQLIRSVSPYWGAKLLDGKPLVEKPTIVERVMKGMMVVICPWVTLEDLENFNKFKARGIDPENYIEARLRSLSDPLSRFIDR